ncbi:MAG TPA: NAD(P)-dependent alcohol dehydrogenase [Glaciibacter sp.]|nr:NAD(P)-dependent alcohol dehydrogenase [Glaciibacter sp.]
MKAVVYSRYGPPDVLRLEEVPKPRPRDDELLIRVHATTVNRTDCGMLRPEPAIMRLFTGLTKPRRKILGNEFAGEVVAAGRDVASFTVGQRVFGFDGRNFGAHAEYLTTTEDGLVTVMPAGMSYGEVAPATEGAHYALALIHAARVKIGQKILVNGATGAIGSATVQLLNYYGAECTAVCDSKNVALVTSLGADRVIDYTRDDFTKQDEKYDVVLDAVGLSSFEACKPILKPNGLYLSTGLGRLAQNPILALTTRVVGTQKVLFPIPEEKKDDIVLLKELMERRMFRPVIDRRYRLEEIREAFQYVESGMKTGNVVITVVDEVAA